MSKGKKMIQHKKMLISEIRNSADETKIIYIQTKAKLYCKMGPEIYRKNDFYKMPDVEWDEELLGEIRKGCEQIIEGKGTTDENPLSLEIGVFYRLMEMFHFQSTGRRYTKNTKENNQMRFLDVMEFKHLVDGSTVILCNKPPFQSLDDFLS